MRFIWGLFGVAIGVMMMWKRYALTQFMGRFDWAEKYFGGGFGGTYFFYILAGFLVIFLSGLYMFGILDHLLSPAGTIFGGLKNQ
jgi:hypothetical protein